MNQILKQKASLSKVRSDIQNKNIVENKKNKKNKTKKDNVIYKLQFFFSSIIAVCFISFLFIRMYSNKRNEKLSKHLMNQYHISTLYSNDTAYSAQLIGNSSNNISSNSAYSPRNPFVIGMIKIDKINLNYPILSETTKELLDISLCRFAGPSPNEVGNFCIAGHNYVDYKLFSRLNELELEDKIKLYDLNRKNVRIFCF